MQNKKKQIVSYQCDIWV